jgi:putative peptide zinc metalloprotease protein
VAIVETRISVWEALAGRAPGQPLGPADPGLWTAVAERVDPAKARPVLRAGIEESHLVSARGVAYTMLRSPDRTTSCYLRLTPEEVELAQLMDGSRTIARLVAEYARISGQLAPNQVRRVVADLAGNRMLEELPVDAFAPLHKVQHIPLPTRFGRGLLAFAQGRRMVLANVDPIVTVLYKLGGRLLFTRAVAALCATVAVLGLFVFGYQWFTGEQSVFLTNDSYLAGAALLLGLNVMALACHELGHALATKHAGRRVPAAGFLVYFGIPSVFVDTTDVWMSGRRGRLLATAAGPATGLVLAGTSALVGFAVPEAAPICFKLSFAWYLNALFNLNPFLALDGYYLVMDWLEVPNLRARGLSWVAGRFRGRPPAWGQLDREGRLVALYGMLAICWLIIALNLGYRVYVDRVAGLATGLWRSGPLAQLLFIVVVAALLSPVVYIGVGWLVKRWRRLRTGLLDRQAERDVPRRLDALRASVLRDLSEPALTALATSARWVHPRTGQQLVLAGGPQPEVFAVVDGALEGRAPSDPGGTVRERVGAGGLVGLGAALSGTTSPLSWYTAGTTLLAMPASAVSAAVGPIGGGTGGSFGTADEAEAVLAESPGLAALSYEDRLGLAVVAVPIAFAPGATVSLSGPDDALVLASGTVETPDGQQLGRGTMIGPVGEANFGPVAVARSTVKMFSLPAVSGLPLLLGTPVGALTAESQGRGPGRPPITGVHPASAYPPLNIPPGPPPVDVDDEADGRFEKKLRWLLIWILLFALLFTGANLLMPVLAWAEMPTVKALVRVETGSATAVVGGKSYALAEGDQIYVGQTDDVVVADHSLARVIYRGGAVSVLCGGTQVTMGHLGSSHGRPVEPSAALKLNTGQILMDTRSGSSAFADLASTVNSAEVEAVNDGPAWYSITPLDVEVSAGHVSVNGDERAGNGEALGCPGTIVSRPSGDNPPDPAPTESPTASPSPSESPTESPSPTPSPTPSPSASPSPTPTTTSPTTTPPTTTTRPVGPRIAFNPNGGNPVGRISLRTANNQVCNKGVNPTISVTVLDLSHDVTSMTVSWKGQIFSGGQAMGHQLFTWSGTVGPIDYPGKPTDQDILNITVTAKNAAGGVTTLAGGPVTVLACNLIIPI